MAQINGSPPVLPVAPFEYQQIYMTQVLNVLRTYFSQNASNLSTVNVEANTAQTLCWMNPNG